MTNSLNTPEGRFKVQQFSLAFADFIKKAKTDFFGENPDPTHEEIEDFIILTMVNNLGWFAYPALDAPVDEKMTYLSYLSALHDTAVGKIAIGLLNGKTLADYAKEHEDAKQNSN